nr:hypothetical protein GCM10020093_054810 [Planobispora longispora]
MSWRTLPGSAPTGAAPEPAPQAATTPDAPPSGSGPDPEPDLGELTFSDWHAHAEKLVGIGFLTIARRLPALIAHAVRLAWLASPATPSPRSPSACSAASSPPSGCWPRPGCCRPCSRRARPRTGSGPRCPA